MTREEIKGRANHGSGWVIEWECREECWSDDHPVSIDFKIHCTLNSGDVLLKGNIKWDGCSNWIEPGGNYFHLCGMRDVENLYSALGMCYTIAGKYMSEAQDHWWQVVSVLMHEAMELSYYRMGLRYTTTPDYASDNGGYLFVADHFKFSEATGRAAHFLTPALPDLSRAWMKWKSKRKNK